MAGLEGVKGYGQSYYDYGSEYEGRKFGAKVSIGAAMLHNSKQNHPVADFNTGLTIPLGERAALEADANAQIGKEVKGGGGEARFVFDANPRLSLKAGAGIHYNNFDQKVVGLEQYDFSYGNASSDDGKLYHKNEYTFSGQGVKTHKSRDVERTVYGTAGADYKVSDKFTLSGGVALGQKRYEGEQITNVENGKYTYVVKEGQEVHYDDIGVTVQQPAQTATTEKTVIETTQVSQPAFVGNVRLGASYDINKNLQAGIVGSIPLNNKSDGFVGARLTVKF